MISQMNEIGRAEMLIRRKKHSGVTGPGVTCSINFYISQENAAERSFGYLGPIHPRFWGFRHRKGKLRPRTRQSQPQSSLPTQGIFFIGGGYADPRWTTTLSFVDTLLHGGFACCSKRPSTHDLLNAYMLPLTSCSQRPTPCSSSVSFSTKNTAKPSTNSQSRVYPFDNAALSAGLQAPTYPAQPPPQTPSSSPSNDILHTPERSAV